MRRIVKLLFVIALLTVSCTDSETTLANPVPSTSTVTSELEVGAAVQCLPIGSAHDDATIYNLIWDGYDVDYERGVWYFHGTEIGRAQFEDEGFNVCGEPAVITLFEKYQTDARENS